MSIRGIYTTAKRVALRFAHVLARPVKKDRGSGGVVVQPYRGYGTRHEFYLMGRVFRQPRVGYQMRTTSTRRDLLDVVRRVLRRGVRDAVLLAKLGKAAASKEAGDLINASSTFPTDPDGYFRIRLKLDQPLVTDQQWHPVEIALVEPVELVGREGATVKGHVYVPPLKARRVIISDIDDTVMYTGVLNKAKMMWRLFMQGPKSRVAFPGVASLYRALHRGPTDDELNPMLYVSRAPWAIYEILDEFFRLHQIPIGPILFLREWGMTWHRPLPRRAEDHKLILIRDMLELYEDFPFVLIGDSGQHDPEIYAQVVQENPGRVAAVYIRNVSRSDKRVHAIEELAKIVIDSGSTLVLASDSFTMAKHAAEHGLISPQALTEVLSERDAETVLTSTAPQSQSPTREIKRTTDQKTRQAVERGELKAVLDETTGTDVPPNVIVESKEQA